MSRTAHILAQPIMFPFSGKIAKNRFMKSAMSERLATFSTYDSDERGQPTEELIRLYDTWSRGDIGILITGNIQIKHDHLEATGNAIIDWDLPSDYVDEFSKLARAAKARGSLVIGQLSHPGRQVSINIQPYPESASDIEQPPAGGVVFGRPSPLTRPAIQDIVDRFAFSACVLHQAGFDGVQLHAAHGFLLAQFLSRRTNQRKDEFGGTLANRSRLLFQIIAAIRTTVNDPKFIISVKLNSQDFTQDGFSANESREIAMRLEQAGVDLIELSGGTYELAISSSHSAQERTPAVAREAYFLDFAEQLRPHIKRTKVAVTGGFRSAAIMAKAVDERAADIIGLGRPLTAEPLLVKELIAGEKTQAKGDKFPEGQLIRMAAAASQIAEIGNGMDITDFDNGFNVSRFLAKLQKEMPATMSEALSSHNSIRR
ncbi:hypothetical protein SERLA73DRAFT_169650 [Serpula lacrymans var. lacrymans S7.3]|uniref:NADH:flavin oxidoreductase/NADH oxidase N-terminal domain-containing protein n=2 Tax=Serpula lacrymans var. lacrymans TaxID=341189 RepID=F8Q248_SERL3|nr:uncharacterized protein SERLADRAFT_416439 [Serpula lacrymans var. lacrymans S7.9]EGN97259.1 hypothetical protein SERLA73DRAFT_169650 [Serpula lacrymans var. lacrymans S7.3]EGO22859.1 hypothetical protein SERLADRAFT_416439 [Serpula lacrymans var. lacrymans S7.9]